MFQICIPNLTEVMSLNDEFQGGKIKWREISVNYLGAVTLYLNPNKRNSKILHWIMAFKGHGTVYTIKDSFVTS